MIDRSKKYIRMSKMAWGNRAELAEIQEDGWYYLEFSINCEVIGDGEIRKKGVYQIIKGLILDTESDDPSFFDTYNIHKAVPLKTQYQLFEMVYEGIPFYQKLRLVWQSFLSGLAYNKEFTSMEQLLLAFLWREKYNKLWDSKRKDWVKAKESHEAKYSKT